jgi:hypothetical protein
MTYPRPRLEGDGEGRLTMTVGSSETMTAESLGMSREEFKAAADLYEQKVRELHPSDAVVERVAEYRKEVQEHALSD